MRTVILLLCTLQIASAATLSDFGKSVEFAKEDQGFTASDLNGKAVFVLYFQSWCGICNGWAPSAIKAFQKAHSAKDGFIFIALKTDGGSVKAAKKFFESKGGDSSRWLVGVDNKAALYKKHFKKTGLWEYMLIDQKGEIKKKSNFGAFFKIGGKKVWSIQGKHFLQGFPKISGSIKIPTQPQLKKAATFVELGQYNKAFSLIKSAKVDNKIKAEFQNTVNTIVENKLVSSIKLLKDDKASSWERFQAMEFVNKVKYLRVKGVKEALSVANKARTVKEISNEQRASKEYLRIMSKYKPGSKRSVESTEKSLKNLANNFPDTHYGKLASKGL